MTSVAFNDIAGINSSAGVVSDWGREVEVTQELIDRFADLTDDHQWIHVDVERATKEGPFGGPIAHGFLTLSLIPGLRPPGIPEIVGETTRVNYGAEKLRFLSPVPAGSKVHARTKLLRAEEKSGGTLVTYEVEVSVVGAERPAILYWMQSLFLP
jgi:acyl dehydratase